MPSFSNLPIMPKEIKPFGAPSVLTGRLPYPLPLPSSTSLQRNAAIWSSSDDEILLQARMSGMNWQPIAARHFPNKTPNACRKRHERLMERRHVEDWDAERLNLLAQEYQVCRKEMWEILAARLGEKWTVVEAKCMEKGFKTLQATARTAQRKAPTDPGPAGPDERGTSDHHSDSGVGMVSDTEMEAVDAESGHKKSASWHAQAVPYLPPLQIDHARSHSLPQPLPLYRPPPPVTQAKRTFADMPFSATPQQAIDVGLHLPKTHQRYSPGSNARGGLSINAVLSPIEPPTHSVPPYART